MKKEEEPDECHQGLEFHTSLISRTEAALDQKFHTINFSFSCDPVYVYMYRDLRNGDSEFLDHEIECTVETSIRVELQDLDNWEEAREELDGLFGGFPMSYQMREELTSFAVDTAKDILLSSGGHRVLHLHIPFDVVHEHIFHDNDDVNRVQFC